MPGTVEGCATRHGTLVGPIMTDITGFAEVTPYKGGWCGNDARPQFCRRACQNGCASMVQKLGDRLWQEGYKGVFCCDFLIDTDTNDSLSRRDQPAHQRRLAADQPDHHRPMAAARCSCSTCWSSWTSTGSSTSPRCRRAGPTTTLEPADPQADRGQGRADHQGAELRHLAYG